jgi:hypothetical protein
MKFEEGKFYQHDRGRCIAVIGTVKTFAWGEMLVIEETDRTGHAISCVTKDTEDKSGNWVEISKDEWMVNFDPLVA